MVQTRRRFIQTAVGMAALAACGVEPVPLFTAASRGAKPTVTLFDPRFAAAHGAARAFVEGSLPQPIGGDIAELAAALFPSAPNGQPLTIAGVTTEVVPFCLEQLARRHGVVRLELQRHDHDLFFWRLALAPGASQ